MTPSKKKTLIFLVAALVVLVLGYFLVSYLGRPISYSSDTDQLSVNAGNGPQNNLTQDSESDGLPNGEEALWKTDSNNPDTDGYGTSDGEEVNTNRDPLVKGPQDTQVRSETVPDTQGPTATQKLTNDILLTYTKLKQSSADEETQINALQELVEKNQFPITAKTYATKDFTTVTENYSSIQNYAKDISTTITTLNLSSTENELSVLQTSLENNSATGIISLTTTANRYRTAVKQLLAMPVPTGALAIHTDITNDMALMGETVSAMSNLYTDPLISLSALKQYQPTALRIANNMNALFAYFKASQTKFTA